MSIVYYQNSPLLDDFITELYVWFSKGKIAPTKTLIRGGYKQILLKWVLNLAGLMLLLNIKKKIMKK